jgi:hypothetical protein
MANFELPDQSQPPAAPSDAPPITPSLPGGALSLVGRWKNDWSSGPQDAGGRDVTPLPANPAYDAVADDSTRIIRMKASAALVAFGGRPLAWAGANPDPNIIRVAGGDAATTDDDAQTAQLQEAQNARRRKSRAPHSNLRRSKSRVEGMRNGLRQRSRTRADQDQPRSGLSRTYASAARS